MSRLIPSSSKATREDTKKHNRRLILKTIYEEGHISRADLARKTQLTRASISNVAATLLAEGWIVERGTPKKAKIGKPATMISINRDAAHVIGLDVANSSFHGRIFDLTGEVVAEEDVPINERRGEDALNLAYEVLDKLMARCDKPLLGIGIGTPGVVEPNEGKVLSAPNLGWRDLELRQLISQRYQVEDVHLANDAQVAALAQYLFGNKDEATGQKKSLNLVLVKVGRGIGSGIVVRGQIFFGDGFSAGEIGHVVVDPRGSLCTCGHYGCLETKASTRALIQEVSLLAQSNPASSLHETVRCGEKLTTEAILQAYHDQDLSIKPVIERSGEYLGAAIAHLTAALNIRHIYITGSMADFGEGFIDPIRQEVKRLSFPALANEVKIETSSLGHNIVSKGAAALVLHHVLGVV